MNHTDQGQPSPETISACQSALEGFQKDTDGVVFAMVATVDGLEVAAVCAPGWDISGNRMAAMASSGHALGNAIAGELTETDCQNVIIDADRLSVVFLAVPEFSAPPLILGAAATKSASLGTVLFGANRCALQIARGELVA